MVEWSVLILAGYMAGILNSIAGGGSFLTFPALVWAGIPPIAANATSAVAVLPGYLGGALGFRHELREISMEQHLRYSIIAILGGLIGALLLLVTPAQVFGFVIPVLLLFATLIFAFGTRLLVFVRNSRLPLPLLPGLFLVAIYGGYFNGGLGIMLLALFAAAGMTQMNLMNGLKNLLSFTLSFISVAAFALAGKIFWSEGLVMMMAASIGGYQGAVLAKRLPVRGVKYMVILMGLLMTLVFTYRLF